MPQPRFIPQPDEAGRELFYFVVNNPKKFPKDMREQLLKNLEPGKSISFAVSEAAEMIYARQEELDDDVILFGAEMAITSSHNRVNNFGDDDGKRGRGIVEALRRASGELPPSGISWPSKKEDPRPKDVYLPPVGETAKVVPAPEPGTGGSALKRRN